jgi:hypothetical protein
MFAIVHATPVAPYVTPGSIGWADIYREVGGPADLVAACRRLEERGATYAIVKDVAGDVGDFDIVGFVSRNPDLFTLVTRSDSGAIYSVDRGAVERCAAR